MFNVHAMVFAKTHKDGCGNETDGLLAERGGHVRCLHGVSVEKVVGILESTPL